jgi:redox-sensitive bicupin YhaK (pirin superfamily)
MPAITVEDPRTLDRVPLVPTEARFRRVRGVSAAPSGLEGEGFPVRRAFAGVDLADLDPFVHMDQMGEVEYAPGEPKGTPWHPHRGFETVTYIIDGIFEHQDSNGGGGSITNGDTQWMTAGAGILHIERPPEHLVVSGGLFHGIQLWVNLPKAEKWAPPRYQDLRATDVSLLSSPDAGALVRVIAGEVAGHAGPGQTYTPMTMLHVSPGARTSTRSPMCWPARVRPASRGSSSRRDSWWRSDRETRSASRRRRVRIRARPSSRCSCSAAARSRSRSPGTARS